MAVIQDKKKKQEPRLRGQQEGYKHGLIGTFQLGSPRPSEAEELGQVQREKK